MCSGERGSGISGMNSEIVMRPAQVLMLISIIMLCNPIVGSRPAWAWVLVGSILLYAGSVQMRVPLMLSVVPFFNTGIWMMLFLSRGPARRSRV